MVPTFISSLEFFKCYFAFALYATKNYYMKEYINKYQIVKQQAATSSRRLHHSATILLTES